MKKIFKLFLVLLIAAAIGVIMYIDTGYVLIAYKNWTLETTIWMLLLLIITTWLVVKYSYSLINLTIHIPSIIKNWLRRTHLKRARKYTYLGLYAFLKGKWDQAEQALIKGAKYSEVTLLNYLFAAKAANNQGMLDKSFAYLAKAEHLNNREGSATTLTKAEIIFTNGDYSQAQNILLTLKKELPHNKHLLDLLQQTYQKKQNWLQLKELLPELRKYKALTENKLTELEVTTYRNLLKFMHLQNHLSEAYDLWNKAAENIQQEPSILIALVDILQDCNNEVVAEKILRKTLKRSWHEELILKYSEINCVDKSLQLSFAEELLNSHPESFALLVCLGKLCKSQQLWGKAQSYFKTALSLGENKLLHQELGNLYEQLGDQSTALQHYKLALKLS